MIGTYQDFLSALLAFESGWDRARYDAGIIQDWQLDQWAGGPVQNRFPQYTSWSQLTDAEWEAMAYQSQNSLGFVGFQFGEALLIDLGYYDDTVFYGNGAATNTWDGTWTGKNGVNSLADFTTKAAQDVAIQEAFGYNLQVIEKQLANSGQSLSDYIGQTATYSQNGQTVTVELTLTGIMAAAHLRGAWGTASLLQSGAVSKDEYGTSILQYMEQFGGFDAPTVAEAIAFYESRLTGDEGLGTPDGGTPGTPSTPGTPGNGDNGSADVDEGSADVVITWSWGQDAVVSNFDPATGTIFVDWIGAADLSLTQTANGVVFAIASNNQTTTLQGVQLSDLSPSNFTILDSGTASKIFGLIGQDSGAPDPEVPVDPDSLDPDPGVPVDPEPIDPDPVEPTPTLPVEPESWNGTAGVTAANASVVITWAWGTDRVVSNFSPQSDTIFIDWFGPEAIDATEVNGNVIFTMASNNQTVTLQGVTLSDLSASNFTIQNTETGREILSQVGSGSGPGMPYHPDIPDGAQMIMILPDSPSRVIPDFDPAGGDMLHLEAGVIAERLEIQDTANGLTVTVLTATGAVASTTVLTGVTLAEMTMNNFMVAEQSALNEVASLLGQTIETPDTGGFDVIYDADGSNTPVPSGASDLGGVKWAAEFGKDDIVGFDPAADQLDFGNASVHGLILNMTPNGEPIVDNPWGPDMQILQGVQLADLTIENFGVVGNEHLRQDLGGVLSWEKGIGPRDGDTVYIRSHEYGQAEVINGFDPATQKISFLYFGTRERLSVEDTPNGMVISVLPSGQSFTFTGIQKADLIPGNLEFHFDQVMEDNLEAPFGIDQNDVSLVSREALLTPEAPAGQTTDGFQVREGVGAVPGIEIPDTPDTPSDLNTADTILLDAGADTVAITWDWGREISIRNFDVNEDVLDFTGLGVGSVSLQEIGSNLTITVENNGGHSYILEGIQAENLSLANLTAASWNSVVTDAGGVADQLRALCNTDFLL